MFTIVYGDVKRGFRLHGLFDSFAEAEEYADVDNPCDSSWVVLEIEIVEGDQQCVQ